MPEPLTPEDIQALLALVREREAESAREEPDHPPDPPIVQVAQPVAAGVAPPTDEGTRAIHRALAAVHERFARGVSASLSELLSRDVDVRLIAVERATYGEFTMSLPIPSAFHRIACAPLEGHMVLDVEPSLLHAMIERLLGGGDTMGSDPDRPFTKIELSVVDTVLRPMVVSLREAWESILEIEFRISETESNPFLRQVAAPEAPVTRLRFAVVAGDLEGAIQLCIPWEVIEPIAAELARVAGDSSRRGPEVGESADHPLGSARVEVAAVLAEMRISLADLLTLRPGDVLDTGRPQDTPVTLSIDGRRKFRGSAALRGDRRIVRVLGEIEPTERDA